MEIDDRLEQLNKATDRISEALSRSGRVPAWLVFAVGGLSVALVANLWWLKLTQDVLYEELERRDRTEKDHRLWMENVFDLIMEDPKRSDSTREKWKEIKKHD